MVSKFKIALSFYQLCKREKYSLLWPKELNKRQFLGKTAMLLLLERSTGIVLRKWSILLVHLNGSPRMEISVFFNPLLQKHGKLFLNPRIKANGCNTK